LKRDLARLLRPKSIAVIGGGTWCTNVIIQVQKFGFDGAIWPVHPSKQTIADLPTYPSVESLPAAPDAVFIGINSHATIEAVKVLTQQGAGGAVCFASGFQEAIAEISDGANLQARLLKAAGKMPIIGPNCYGFINALDGALLWPDQHGATKVSSGVAIITQSSNIAINITMQRRALPLAYVVTAGNQAQIGLAEIGVELLRDPRVTALGLHIEGVGDIRALEMLSKQAAQLGKPVIALKVGTSGQARAATISHTASLAGSNAGARALLHRLGIPQVNTLPEFIEALKLLHISGPLTSNNIASMSCSGGEASLMADLAIPTGVTFPALNSAQSKNLRTALGSKVKLANPLDYHTYIWADTDAMANAFSAMMDPSLALGILVSDFPRADMCDASDWDSVIAAIIQTKQRCDLPMAIAASLPENMPEHVAQQLTEAGIIPLCGLQEALVAARVGAQCGHTTTAPSPILLPRPPRQMKTLSEAKAKAALAKHGLSIPRSARSNVSQLNKRANAIGFPLVLKGENIAHKTEAGAVALNLIDTAQVTTAAQGMPCDSFLLEEMITGAVCELLVGVVLDEAHGYVLTIGAGGTLTELLEDSASLLIPTTAAKIKLALGTLKVAKLLHGYRSASAANIDAIVDAALSVQDYVIQNHGAIAEVEVNPLLCLPDRAIAADALILIGETND